MFVQLSMYPCRFQAIMPFLAVGKNYDCRAVVHVLMNTWRTEIVVLHDFLIQVLSSAKVLE